MTTDAEEAERQKADELMYAASSLVFKEMQALAQLDTSLVVKLAHLKPDDSDQSTFDQRVIKLAIHLGGPHEHYLVRVGTKPPIPDNYPDATIHEIFDVFSRARKATLRTALFRMGSDLLGNHGQDGLDGSEDDPKFYEIVKTKADEALWEHAETAYIRLVAYWDRVGQLLDFAFFNVRKFDQNGFTSVMDRIHKNLVPMDPELAASRSWKRLRDFQCSKPANGTTEEGLKWLLERRNLLIHSLHLHPVAETTCGLFETQYNHLDVAHREKMRPRDPVEEVNILSGHINKAAELFDDVISIAMLSPSRMHRNVVQ